MAWSRGVWARRLGSVMMMVVVVVVVVE